MRSSRWEIKQETQVFQFSFSQLKDIMPNLDNFFQWDNRLNRFFEFDFHFKSKIRWKKLYFPISYFPNNFCLITYFRNYFWEITYFPNHFLPNFQTLKFLATRTIILSNFLLRGLLFRQIDLFPKLFFCCVTYSLNCFWRITYFPNYFLQEFFYLFL